MSTAATNKSPSIRIVGDPVLRKASVDVTEIDGEFVELTQRMFQTMYDAPGIGLAAPQVGVGQRFFVYDMGDEEGERDQRVLVNPVVAESDGEWEFSEGCLSVPGLNFDIVRPKTILVTGRDLEGNEVEFEADELLSRLIQHELDHLDGVLLLDYLDEDVAKDAKRQIREFQMGATAPLEAPQAPIERERKSFFRFK